MSDMMHGKCSATAAVVLRALGINANRVGIVDISIARFILVGIYKAGMT